MYDLLFSPYKLGNVEVKNRLVVTAMVTNYCNYDGTLTEKYMRYHEEKAKGGWGLIITEDYSMREHGKGYDRIPGFYKDEHIALNKEFTERIHKYGAKVVCQIYHPGRQSNQYVNGGVQNIAPSPIPCPWLKQIPHELTVDEIHEIVEQFGDAARRAKESGFDGVEIHLAHGYLLFEFLSPYTNKRTDEYGGCFKNRFRIVKEVFENVKSKVGDDYLVGCRLSSRDGYFGGRDVFDSMELAMNLEAIGAMYINVSSGMYGNHQNNDIDVYAHGFNVPNTEKIKSVVSIPVFTTNRMTTAGVAEAVLKSGRADLIGMGRTSLADPWFPNKVKEGREEEVRHCINCNIGCYGELLAGRQTSCLANPTVGRESELDAMHSDVNKKIYIAGGGPGGMYAAIYAKKKGYTPVLFEAKDRLGGQLLSAAYPPGKGEVSLFTQWLIAELKRQDIEVRLNTKLTKEIVEADKPDAVIVAAGGTPTIPPIKGIDLSHVCVAEDALMGKVVTGDDVVVCGGGEVGVETAVAMAHRENGKVTIVEMLPSIYADMNFNKQIKEYDIAVHASTKVKEITEDAVIVEKDGKEFSIPAKTVILAFGYRPNNKLAEELEGLCEVRTIGGSIKTSNAFEAGRDAFNTLLEL